MYGRYGFDQLSRFLSTIVYALFFLQLIFRKVRFSYLAVVIVAIQLFRCFSKNHVARAKENRVYLRYEDAFLKWFKLQIRRIKERKNYRFRKCPNCGKVLRLPKRKGKHTVNCPNCCKEFTVRIL